MNVSADRLKILPSILSAPFDRLGEAVCEIEKAGCGLLHVDVMDGHFVPNLTMGPLVIDSLRPACKSEFDVHLMVSNPAQVIPWFERERVRSITIHAETEPHLHVRLRQIKEGGRLAGISFNPGTPLDCLPLVADQVDIVLIMTVNPGFGGQTFIEPMRAKIRETVAIRERCGKDFIIQVDGGVNDKTVALIAQDGAEELVAGNAVFGASDPAEAYRKLDDLLKQNAKS